jgi:peptidyl-prolyl cis-trans isomerase SurA
MQEYRDGILLFDITDENVWSKAIRDSAGLAAFHDQNRSKYMWDQRAKATVYQCKDAAVAEKTRKMISKRAKKKYTNEDIKKEINATSQLNLQVEEGLFSKGDNESVDANSWMLGISPNTTRADGSIVFVEYVAILEPTPKEISEARGLITADYQTYLEQAWIKELRAKHKVEVNQEVFKTVK